MSKKLFRSILCIVIGAIIFVGCQSKAIGGQSSEITGENEEIVTLKWYMCLNKIAPDTELVIEELNKYTREKIGVQIDYTVMLDSEYREKMMTYINFGEAFDICFTSNWAVNYFDFLRKGAFKDITELLPQYAKETYEFIPEEAWESVAVGGRIYGVPSYKEMGWQGGILVNSDLADRYDIDLSNVKSIQDYTKVLEQVAYKSELSGNKVIGVSGLSFYLAHPYETLTGEARLPGISAVPEYDNFEGVSGVFNQYETNEYMAFCNLIYEWQQRGFQPEDAVNYDKDSENRDTDFAQGNLFSYLISYAPGDAEAKEISTGHGVEFIRLMEPLSETRNSNAAVLAISSQSAHPEKALEFINLLNTDLYVGTLIRHGIEGVHYSEVGANKVDRTKDGQILVKDNRYDYAFGWQFGTPFNQKWDISYPDNIAQLFEIYNETAIIAPHRGFRFNQFGIETLVASLLQVVNQYSAVLETGTVDPLVALPQFREQLKLNGVDQLLAEINKQLEEWKVTNGIID
ncbi:MAG: ABC transporter substrate-binding protein [Cellulosilyticaceae bacterium]